MEGANVIKLHRYGPGISYLSYPNFDRDPHPAPASSLLVGLRTLRVEHRDYDYASTANPPVLHRKEAFVGASYPKRDMFARLTQAEERAGLFVQPESIGTRAGWADALRQCEVSLSGHRVVRAAPDGVDRRGRLG